MAPIRPVKQMKQAAMMYPTQTQIQHCHQERDVIGVPPAIMAEAIIQVLILKLSAIQNPTKFHAPHCRLSGSTGRFVSLAPTNLQDISCLTRLQVMISEKQLGIGQAGLALDGDAIGEADAASSDRIHDGLVRGDERFGFGINSETGALLNQADGRGKYSRDEKGREGGGSPLKGMQAASDVYLYKSMERDKLNECQILQKGRILSRANSALASRTSVASPRHDGENPSHPGRQLLL